ncbi:ATP-dependent DNA helicase DinG [Shewanella putrefaciens]|nr:ATP-dependent DNA helicase DinG [Shewanella putrefaciens]
MQDHIADLIGQLNQVAHYCDTQTKQFANPESRYRFEHGVLPETLRIPAENLATTANLALKQFNKMQLLLTEAIKDGDIPKHQSEALQAEMGFMLQRLENLQKLWRMMAKEDKHKGAPMARWIELITGKQVDYLFSASPIEVGFMLESMLWQKAAGVVLCSATLRALNNFDHFVHQVGLSLNDGSRYLALQSPSIIPIMPRCIYPK